MNPRHHCTAIRCRLIAHDEVGARADADWALEAEALPANGSIMRYCAVLALLVRGEDGAAHHEAETLLS